MMGTSHAISGAAAWVAITATVPSALGVVPLDTAAVTAGAVIAAGAALLPDADHHNATIAHSVPVAGRMVASAVGAASGGHRQGMHSILAVIGCLLLSWAMGTVTYDTGWELMPVVNVGAMAATLFLTTFASKVLRMARSWGKAWLFGAVTAILLSMLMPESALWLPLCVTLGYAVHLLGDMLTIGGVPLLWPLKPKPPKIMQAPLLSKVWQRNGFFAVPVLGTTGSPLETLLSLAMGAYLAGTLGWTWMDAMPAVA